VCPADYDDDDDGGGGDGACHGPPPSVPGGALIVATPEATLAWKDAAIGSIIALTQRHVSFRNAIAWGFSSAPIRLVVPWKYGFKSIKSVVGIKFVEKQPPTTWNILAANEYGFYANVNPAVDHPRWSQASERRITTGGIFDQNRIATLPFNGYGEEVAGLYTGMNLRKYY
jgi:hypothetical protein